MLYTGPDVAYALGIVSRFQADPREDHWIVVKNILKYLRRTKDIFSRSSELEEYQAANYS